MTEEQAMATWCHKLKREYDGAGELHPSCCCIASDCQAWEWGITPSAAATANSQANLGLVAEGHCGLAGK